MESPRSASPAGERATVTASQDRVDWYLGRAGIRRRPPTIAVLEKPRARDFQPELPVHRDAAQTLLKKQRASNNDPGSSTAAWLAKRSVFGARKQKEPKSSGERSPFTRYHVAKALDELLSSNPLPPVGMAQALLSQAGTTTTLEELWRELHVQHDSESKKALASRTIPELTWLDTVVRQQDMDYVHLLSQSTVDQETLDRAFGIALSHSSTAIMKLLLSFGATATSHLETIREQYRINNLDLLTLLLSAPKSLTTADWLRCLLPEPIASTATEHSAEDPEEVFILDALLVCVAHRPDLAHEPPLLLEILRRQDLEATAIVLAYADDPRGAFSYIRQQAFELVCRVQDTERRLAFFDLLARSNLLVDDPVTREALASSVQTKQLARAKLLIDAGVSVDVPPHNILQQAVSQLSFSVLESFRNATMSLPASLILTYLPDSVSGTDMVRLIEIFGPRSMAGENLDSHLVRAVRRGQLRLVRMLLRCGASVEFDRGAAIRTALEKSDMDALDILLRHDCSREILSAAIPGAMALVSRAKRLRAMGALTEKGVHHDTLGMPLQDLVAEAGDTDMALVRLLLQHRAPVDLSDEPERNPVLVAAKRGDTSLLRMLLCRAKPRPRQETLSAAVPIALSGIETAGYEAVLSNLTMLLQRGAAGSPIDQTLAKAAALGHAGLDIVCVLLAHRADANSANGLSFVRAVEGGNLEMLGVLTTACPPEEPGLRSALQTVIDPRYYSLEALQLLLDSAHTSVVSSVLNDDSCVLDGRLHDHPNTSDIILCLLRHALDINQNEGHVLSLAVRSKDIDLLRTLLTNNPNDASLATALASATRVKAPKVRHLMWELILEKAASSDIGQSTSLIQEIPTALKGDMTGVRLLLRHGARVDFGGALAIRNAAAAGSLPVLELLLSRGGDAVSVSMNDKAFLAASASSITLDAKETIFSYLLATGAGVSTDAISKALTESVTARPDDGQLPRILLTHGARAEFHALKAAVASASSDLFEILTESITDASMAKDMFLRFRRVIRLDADRRYRAYRCLLARGADDKHDISIALADSLMAGPDHRSVAQLLHDHGATLNSWDGSAIITEVTKTRDLGAIRFLGEHLVSRGDDSRATAHSMFSRLHRDQDIDLDMRLEIYKALLPCKLSKSDLHNGLVASVQGPHRSTDVVRLLLAHGADPNLKKKPSCFLMARENNAEAEFRVLCEHADLGVVLPALLDGDGEDEASLAPWVRWCLEAQPQSAKGPGPHHDAVFRCMRRFPEGTAVLDILLDHGVGASAKTDCFFRDYWEWEGEECTALMWSLVSEKPRVSNKTILHLVARGDAVLPAYVSPLSNVSAAFLCLLDKSRTPVLEALIGGKNRDVLKSTISGSTLRNFASKGSKAKLQDEQTFTLTLFEDDDEIGLREAALFLGNLEAFRLLHGGTKRQNRDDGTLHLAALLALPDFVHWLLEPPRHDPNHESEAFDMMVPLALACYSKPFPWCKFAAARGDDWTDRLRQTMQLLLAAGTDPGWRHRKRSVLHIALENGSEVTRALLLALEAVAADDHRPSEADVGKRAARDHYKYVDKTGAEYSPRGYVEEFTDVDGQEKLALPKCLEGHGIN